ncbi:MAG: hypothetical protein CMF70_07635 [Magnetovibrio sp.]|nr:hypothetical protein [Magnetovibrio sp.]
MWRKHYMNINKSIIRTADICDEYPEASVIQINFKDYGKKHEFQGVAVIYSTFEDIRGIKELLASDGEGKVLLVNGQGSLRRALCGGKIAAKACSSGWEGLIFNGAIRDQHEIVEIDIGIKAIGSSPKRPSQDGIGGLKKSTVLGDVVVNSGDYIYADRDGVVVLTANAK